MDELQMTCVCWEGGVGVQASFSRGQAGDSLLRPVASPGHMSKVTRQDS